MVNLLQHLYEYLLQSPWGRGVAVLLLIGAILLVLAVLRREAQWQELAKRLHGLSRTWPFLNPLGIEFRARAFTEALFAGWNQKDLSFLKPHAAGYVVDRFWSDLETAVAQGTYKPFEIRALDEVRWAWGQLPSADKRAGVILRMSVQVPNPGDRAKSMEMPFMLSLLYQSTGDWQVVDITFRDALPPGQAESSLDEAGMMNAQIPTPSDETLHPVRERGPWQTARSYREAWIPCAGGILGLAGFLYMAGMAFSYHLGRQDLLQNGERVQARITNQSMHEDGFVLQYLFQPSGQKRNYPCATPAYLTMEEGVEAAARGTLEVVYDPANPKRNLAVQHTQFGDPITMSILAIVLPVGLVAAIVGGVIWLRRDPSVYWATWNRQVSRYRKPRLR